MFSPSFTGTIIMLLFALIYFIEKRVQSYYNFAELPSFLRTFYDFNRHFGQIGAVAVVNHACSSTERYCFSCLHTLA